jgi:hypothetical protein
MKLKSIFATILICVIVAVLILAALPFLMYNNNAPLPKARTDIAATVGAIKSFQVEYGFVPSGENSNVVRILAGDNPKKIVYLNFRRLEENPNVMFDPWKTPYQFEFFQGTNFIIRSAGKNKIFDTMDDIIFNSVSNDFVKP